MTRISGEAAAALAAAHDEAREAERLEFVTQRAEAILNPIDHKGRPVRRNRQARGDTGSYEPAEW